MGQPVRISVSESIEAFEALTVRFKGFLAEAQKRTEVITDEYQANRQILEAKRRGDTSGLTLPLEEKIAGIKAKNKISVILEGGEQRHTLSGLTQKIEGYDSSIEQLRQESAKTTKQIDPNPWKVWNYFRNNAARRSIERNAAKIAALDKESTPFREAHGVLGARIEEMTAAARAKASADLAVLKADLQAHRELTWAIPHVENVLETLKSKGNAIKNISWDVHPGEMTPDQLSRVDIEHTMQRERFTAVREAQHESGLLMQRQLLNGRTPEDVSRQLARNTPFVCAMKLPHEEYFSSLKKLPDSMDIRYELHDPALVHTGSQKPVPLFSGHLLWHPEEHILGVVSVRTHPDMQDSGIGRVAVRNIFDLAKSLGAKRIELLAGEEAGPYFWAKSGARLQPGHKLVYTDMHGVSADHYMGADTLADMIKHRLEFLQEKGIISAEKSVALHALARSEAPEKVLWEMADDKVPFNVPYSDKPTNMAEYFLTSRAGEGPIKYAARFELGPEHADTRHAQRMNAYLAPELALEKPRYETSRAAMLARSPESYAVQHTNRLDQERGGDLGVAAQR